MKQKTGSKLLSFLLTLAMVVGLMPGMSLTAKADEWTSIKMDGTQLKKGSQDWNVESDSDIDGIEKKLSLPAGNYRLDSDIQTGGAIVVNSGTVNFDLNGHGIIASGGFNVFYMKGDGNLSITDSSPSTVHGYTISNPSNENGAGLATVHSTKQNGDTEFKGGFITGGKKTKGGIWGGAIQLKEGTCNCTVTGCTLIGNNASCGGAVNVQGNGSLSMSGTAIIGNTSDAHGGGVYNQGSSGTVTLTNCTIKYNYAGANGGGGVRVYQGSVTINGGTITNNACPSSAEGGGVSLTVDGNGSSLLLKGDVSIKDNYSGTTVENLRLADTGDKTSVIISGALTCDDGSIGVTMSGPGVFTKTAGEKKEELNNVSKFTSDNTNYVVGKNTDGQLFIGTPISSVAVTDITAPVATEALDTGAATSTGNVSLGTVTWNPADASAAYATEYTATVIATANKNYAFTDNATATVNGNAATVTKNQDGTLSISYTFDKTNLTPVTITAAESEAAWSADGIVIPVEGMFTITEGAGAATYSVANDTGEGTYDAQTGKLTVTKCGKFTVKVSTAATETYAAGAETSSTLTVSKAPAPVLTGAQKPKAKDNLIYTGEPQELVTPPGEVPAGYAVQYSLDGTNWSTEIPKGTDVGNYTVKVKYVGDDNHTTFDGEDIPVTIALELTDAQKPKAKDNLTYTGEPQELVTPPG
ncbi:MAG: hypothetical protein IKO25_01010, partial [Clostridia bacterium]|nr:hypothetical protein [Clostridia bacterium]